MWIRFIGRKKLALTDKDTMRLTLRHFLRLYQIYKNDFDLELSLKLNKLTYAQAKKKAEQDEEWI